MITNRLEELYLEMEIPYREEQGDKFIISGCLKGIWCRFTWFKQMNTLVVVNTQTGERLIYKY